MTCEDDVEDREEEEETVWLWYVGCWEEEDDAEALWVALPIGAPSPALIESSRFQLEEGEGAAACICGRLGAPPFVQLATVSSPIR